MAAVLKKDSNDTIVRMAAMDCMEKDAMRLRRCRSNAGEICKDELHWFLRLGQAWPYT